MGKGRAPCCDKTQVKRGPWSPAEDLRLITFIQKHGHDNWRALPKLSGLKRCGKSCRLRWINYLRPDVKRGNFTKDEEEAIIRLHKDLGNKWAKIAAHFPGRTDNEIKNVWNTHLKKGSSSLSNENHDKPTFRLELQKLISPLVPSLSSSSAISTVSEHADGTDQDGISEQVLKEATNEEQGAISTAAIPSNSTSSDASNLSNSIIVNPTIDGDHVIGDGEEEILLIDALVFDDEVNDLLSDVSKPENNAIVTPNNEELVSWPEANGDFWDLLNDYDTSPIDCDVTIDVSKPNTELHVNEEWLRNLECELGLDGETMASEEDQNQQEVLDYPIDQTMIDAMFSSEIEEPGLSISWDID